MDAQKSLATLAVSSFTIPGDSGFPLNAFLTKPATRGEAGERDGFYIVSPSVLLYISLAYLQTK